MTVISMICDYFNSFGSPPTEVTPENYPFAGPNGETIPSPLKREKEALRRQNGESTSYPEEKTEEAANRQLKQTLTETTSLERKTSEMGISSKTIKLETKESFPFLQKYFLDDYR